jgi:hypothetical protein
MPPKGSTSKRRSGGSPAIPKEPAPKRRKISHPSIGAQSEADHPKARISAPSSSLASVRLTSCPSLVVLCVRVFVSDTAVLSKEWARYRSLIQALPSPLLRRIFVAMKSTCPQVMTHNVVHSNFLRGQCIALSGELPVSKATITCLAEMGGQLTELELIDLANYSDEVFASPLRKLPSLIRVVLRGCSKVGTSAVHAIADNCPALKTINLSYTAAPPISISGLLLNCRELETLKLAGILNWTDGTFSRLLNQLATGPFEQFLNITALKFRQTALTESSVNTFLALCPSLRRLDASFMAIHHLPALPLFRLEKLSLKSTGVPVPEILKTLSSLNDLKVLSLGALGSGQGANAMIRNSSAMSLTDDSLSQLTAVLAHLPHLESLDLVGNTKLGITRKVDRPLQNFIKIVGRRCKVGRAVLGILPFLTRPLVKALESWRHNLAEFG